jgi:hypothetical protein
MQRRLGEKIINCGLLGRGLSVDVIPDRMETPWKISVTIKCNLYEIRTGTSEIRTRCAMLRHAD